MEMKFVEDHSSFINNDLDRDIMRCEKVDASFHIVGRGVPKSTDSSTEKLCWLRSQIIGGSAEFQTPFGRRRLTYADHTASGRSLLYVENYITTELLPSYGNSHTSDSYVGCESTKAAREATKYVKECLGGGEEDALIFCGSGSTAAIKRLQEVMGIAVPSTLRERVLKCLSDEERWVVLLGPYEHHSNLLSWRQSLAEVVEIALDPHGRIDMAGLEKSLSFYRLQNRPMLGSFSACSNVTGIYTDTRAVARLLHQYGAFACFDFATSGPYAKIDMRSSKTDGYDAIFVSPHKFVGGPATPGLLLMSNVLYRLGSSPPSTCGGGTVDYVNNFDEKDTIYIGNVEEREDAGTQQNIQKTRAALSFWIKEYIGYEAIHEVEKKYVARALRRLRLHPDISVLGNTDVERQPIFSFLVHYSSPNKARAKPLHGSFVAKLLNDLFGIQARGGCACAGPYGHSLLNIDPRHSLAIRSYIQKGYVGIKPGWTRVSFPYHTSEEEFDFIISSIEFIATYGQRFLWCYDFSWRTGSWTFNKNIKPYKDKSASSLPTMLKALNIEHNEKQANMKRDVALRYTNYLETAKHIATLLPKYPSQKQIPLEIDVDLVHFWV